MTSGNGLDISWTAFNKPESITRGTSQLIFSHDTERARFRQVGPTGETLYLNDGVVVSELLAGTGGTVEWTDYLFAAEEMIGMRVEHSVSGVYTRYFQKDHLNSIAVITDETGAMVEQLSYDAWGKRRYAANGADDPAGSISSQTNRGFTGHEQLEEVGLVHMNGRVYDPLIGRFTSADPVTPKPYTTQSWNRYSYVANNPLKFLDPTGHFAVAGGLGTAGSWTAFGDLSSLGSGEGDVDDSGKSDVGTGEDGPEENEQETGVPGLAYHETEAFARQAYIASALAATNAAYGEPITQKSSVAETAMADFVQGTVDLVPGAFFSGKSQQEFAAGNYVTGTTYAVMSLIDAAVGIATLGATSLEQMVARKAARLVALDTNAIIAAVEKGRTAAVLQGQSPVVSITATKEFFRGGGAKSALRSFLVENNGKMGAAGLNANVEALQSQAAALGRTLHTPDARIAASAQREGLELVTNDKRLSGFLNAIGSPVRGH